MTQYSQHEIDLKIHAFMTKKMKEFPELDEERYHVEHTGPIEKRDSIHRQSMFPTLRLNTLY